MLSKFLTQEVERIITEFVEKDLFEQALDAINKIIIQDKPKPRTISNRYSLFKKEMKKVTDDGEFLAKIKPADELTSKLIEENIKRRDIENTMLDIDEDLINKIISFKNSNDPHILALFLLFCSGRRSSELLEANFSLSENTNFINVKGLKKTRGLTSTQKFLTICFPEEFLNLLKKFRKLLNNKTTFNTILNRRIKKFLAPNLNAHNLRGVYAVYLFKFSNPNNVKINQFIKIALNHESIESSLSYTGYKITFDKKIL